jgi:hypothetical protein
MRRNAGRGCERREEVPGVMRSSRWKWAWLGREGRVDSCGRQMRLEMEMKVGSNSEILETSAESADPPTTRRHGGFHRCERIGAAGEEGEQGGGQEVEERDDRYDPGCGGGRGRRGGHGVGAGSDSTLGTEEDCRDNGESYAVSTSSCTDMVPLSLPRNDPTELLPVSLFRYIPEVQTDTVMQSHRLRPCHLSPESQPDSQLPSRPSKSPTPSTPPRSSTSHTNEPNSQRKRRSCGRRSPRSRRRVAGLEISKSSSRRSLRSSTRKSVPFLSFT